MGYEACAEAAVRAGVRTVQLRMKHATREERLLRARNVRAITCGTPTRFIVNDDPALAEEVRADGVHLGQADMPLADARRLHAALRFFGLSTHSVAQAEAAEAAAPDYIGVGPVYATPTKEVPDAVLGCAEAGRIIHAVRVPAVAIGGIDETTLPQVLAAGAEHFAVVRAVCASSAPFDAIRRLQDLWPESRRMKK